MRKEIFLTKSVTIAKIEITKRPALTGRLGHCRQTVDLIEEITERQEGLNK